MPWCPKCKTEYREGFTVCADCGSELAAEKPKDGPVGELWEEETGEDSDGELWEEETGEDSDGELWEEETGEDSDDELWEESNGDIPGGEQPGRTAGSCPQSPAAGSGKTCPACPAEETADMQGEKNVRQRTTGGSGLYQDSSERASDNRSSAWVLLVLGTLGLIVVILGVAGILPLRLGNPYLFYGVMGAIFILFVVAGIVSMKNARFFDKKAESENSLRQTLLDWCGENLKAEDIDAEVCAAGVSEEVAYFRRFSCIKDKLNHQFINLNQGFLDQFIDDYIYDRVFGEGTE